MKKSYNRWLCFALAGILLLPGCADGVPESGGKESTTTTATTTTAATTTSKDATISTASTTFLTKPSKTATISSALTSTTADLPGDNQMYAPKELWPEEDKQRLLVNVKGEQVRLSLDYAYVKNRHGDFAWWKYSGKTKSGENVDCTVVDERIYSISLQITNRSRIGTEQKAIADFVKMELEELGIEEISAELDVRIIYNKGDGTNYAAVIVPLSEVEQLACKVCKTSSGKYVLTSFSARHNDGETIRPGLTEHEFDCFIPNWC